MKKIKEIKFICNKCGEEQKKDEKQSNKNWSVYDAKEKCKCGGSFKPKLL